MTWLKRCSSLVACSLSLVLIGCGVDATGVVGGSNAVSVSSKETGADVCLVDLSGIAVVHRPGLDIEPARALREFTDSGGADNPLSTLLELLVSGPTPDEHARGLWTEVPGDIQLVIEDRTSLVNALNSIPLEGVELAQPIAVTVVSSFVPTEMAAEQVGCTLERYLARSGVVAQVILRRASDEVVPRAGTAEMDDGTG